MTERVLLIDDDEDLLRGLRRRLKKKFDVTTAIGGEIAIALVQKEQPFAVVVSDMRMPGMNGLEVLKEFRKLSPDTQRIMLTGNLDQETAVEAVNQGSIFRFYTKPCSADDLGEGISAAIRQYQLIAIERDLLEKTLAGSVKVLTDVLALAAPKAFRHSSRFRDWARIVAPRLPYPRPWQLEIAAMLSPIGQVTLPAGVAAKWESGEILSDEEQEIVTQTPAAGKRLIENIPRMQGVAEIVFYQDKAFDGSGFPHDDIAGADIPLGARILKIFKGLNVARSESQSEIEAFTILASTQGQYDPDLINRVRICFAQNARDNENDVNTYEKIKVAVSQLRPDDVLDADVFDIHGVLLLAYGTKLSDIQIEKLHNLKRMQQLQRDADSIAVSRPERED